MKLLSAKEVAEKLGVSDRRVRFLITSGKLPAIRVGNSYVIQESDLKVVAERKNGRPKKVASKE
ncbi:MAG: helix-turn-helix domain-containing protein [Pyrinomonadaceae bacterium]